MTLSPFSRHDSGGRGYWIVRAPVRNAERYREYLAAKAIRNQVADADFIVIEGAPT
jgi:uncharacterized protein (DUF1330 family)